MDGERQMSLEELIQDETTDEVIESTTTASQKMSVDNTTASEVTAADATTAFSIECVILQHPVIASESSQILMINDSFSSQTWAILIPNRNYDQKSM